MSIPLIQPPFKIGQTIGLLTPSSDINSAPLEDPRLDFERRIVYLEALGFNVLMGEHALDKGFFGAGTPA